MHCQPATPAQLPRPEKQRPIVSQRAPVRARPECPPEPHPLPPLLSLQALRGIATIPNLTHKVIEGETELSIIRCAQSKDKAVARLAGEILLKAHHKAIHHWTHRYSRKNRGHDLPFEDLHQEAQAGFLKAVHKFDFAQGVKLMTYANWWLRADTGRAITYTGFTIQMPAYVAERPMERWSEGEKACRRVFRLDAPVHHAGSEMGEPGLTYVDTLPASAPSPEMTALENIDMAAAKKALSAALKRLSPKEQITIRRRFLGRRDDSSLRDVGAEIGVTRERVRQIEVKALAKLRTFLSGRRTRAAVFAVLDVNEEAPRTEKAPKSRGQVNAGESPRRGKRGQAPSRPVRSVPAAAP